MGAPVQVIFFCNQEFGVKHLQKFVFYENVTVEV